MKKIFLLLILSITYSVANIGKITAVKGEVFIIRDAKQIIAKSGSILILKDQVQTKKKAKALVLFKDNTSITVGNNSLLSVNEFVMDLKTPSKSKTNFGFGKGVFRTITGKIGKINPKGFKIKTKSASIGIRGTTLDTSVKILPNGSEQVDVAFLKGHGIITNNNTGVSTPVAKGQNASMNQDGTTQVKQGPLAETKKMNEESTELEAEETKTNNEEKKPTQKKEPKKENDNKPQVKNKVPVQKETPPVVAAPVPSVPEPPVIEDVQNNAPIVSDTKITASEDSTAIFTVNAVDTDGDVLTYSITKQPTHGKATIDSKTGKITYIPDANYNGNEIISVSVTDGQETVAKDISFDITAINDAPTIDIDSPTPNPDGTNSMQFSYTATDIEDGADVTVTVNASHGNVSLVDGKMTYSPSADFVGEDIITMLITDKDGKTTSEIIRVTIDENNTITGFSSISPIGELDTILDEITKKSMCQGRSVCDSFNQYLDFGYILNNENVEIGTYVNGAITPSQIIASYISNNQIGNYSGEIAALVNGVSSGGTINLDMNFGTKNFTGNIKVTQGDWQANISGGQLNPNGFNTTQISSITNSGKVDDITGNLTGKYYGPNAEAVGGVFNLNSNTKGSVSGVFGGSK